MPFPVTVAVILALVFAFINGFYDSANLVATAISARALSPRWAFALATLAVLAGPFLFGTAVATTVGAGVVNPQASRSGVIVAALLSAILWSLMTWFLGIPSSTSHALIGGILGAAILEDGIAVVQTPGLVKIAVALFVSPIAGLAGGYLLMKVVLFLVRGASPGINVQFRRLQVLAVIGLGLGLGANDAQKAIGIITLALVAGGTLTEFQVPLWAIAAGAVALALGVGLGGWRIIHTVGGKFYKVRPVHGFAAQTTAMGVLLAAALWGGLASTTQVVNTAIWGVGSAERISKVRWSVAADIAWAWVLTIPVTMLLGALVSLLIRRVPGF
ncbi:MAG: inorganic phosphate transporter [Anaerolineae bacterium]|nr:inorganic phosphate transporter [Anaerolineae bacterium]